MKLNKQIINIQRASASTINTLIELGVIYVGKDDQLHVVDVEDRVDE